ncbi:MAG: DUF6597 domain-containing transcriptional factor, partial [Gillisia sp.]
MVFKDIFPCFQLQEFIALYRLRHFIIPPTLTPHPKPYPAQPEHCITFYPRGAEITQLLGSNTTRKRPRSIISGQFTQRINRSSLYSEILIIVVVFKPGALYRLTGIPFHELNNLDIDLEVVFPKKAREVNDLLSSSNSYTEMISIIEKFLLSLTESIKIEARKSDRIFHLISENNQKYSLAWLAGQACLSPRQFERKSQQYIGVNPKLFSRIARFNQTYWLGLKEPSLDWLSIAVICGYHDY